MEHLRLLQSMLEEGFIGKEEYDQRRKQVIDRATQTWTPDTIITYSPPTMDNTDGGNVCQHEKMFPQHSTSFVPDERNSFFVNTTTKPPSFEISAQESNHSTCNNSCTNNSTFEEFGFLPTTAAEEFDLNTIWPEVTCKSSPSESSLPSSSSSSSSMHLRSSLPPSSPPVEEEHAPLETERTFLIDSITLMLNSDSPSDAGGEEPVQDPFHCHPIPLQQTFSSSSPPDPIELDLNPRIGEEEVEERDYLGVPIVELVPEQPLMPSELRETLFSSLRELPDELHDDIISIARSGGDRERQTTTALEGSDNDYVLQLSSLDPSTLWKLKAYSDPFSPIEEERRPAVELKRRASAFFDSFSSTDSKVRKTDVSSPLPLENKTQEVEQNKDEEEKEEGKNESLEEQLNSKRNITEGRGGQKFTIRVVIYRVKPHPGEQKPYHCDFDGCGKVGEKTLLCSSFLDFPTPLHHFFPFRRNLVTAAIFFDTFEFTQR
jgi:hypothetical protein